MENIYDRHDLENKIPLLMQNILGIKRNPIINIILIAAIALSVATLAGIVFLTGEIKYSWSHLLYLPIVFGAFIWGWRGGVLVGFAGDLLLGPLMPIDIGTGQMQDFHNWFLRLFIFCFIGTITKITSEYIINMTKKLYTYSANLLESYENLLYALANSLDARDKHTHRHSEVVARLAVEIGKRMKLPKGDLLQLERLGLLHDISKIGIPNEILNKPGALDNHEWEVMQGHTLLEENIIKPVKFLEPITKSIRGHHEKWDGSGYPDGIKGRDIPLFSRIINVADVYQAIISERPYRQSYLSHEEAQSYIKEKRGALFDPSVVDAFLEIPLEMLKKICDGDSQDKNGAAM